MSKEKIEKDQLMASIRDAGRQLSGVTVQFHHLVSERAGLTGGDHKYLDILLQYGPMTAGKLAELSGLTTGAVTAVLDRLEKQNLVKRERDPADRRKVIAVPNHQLTMEKLGPIFASLEAHLTKANSTFTLEQLQTIHKYMETSISVFTRMINDLKSGQ